MNLLLMTSHVGKYLMLGEISLTGVTLEKVTTAAHRWCTSSSSTHCISEET